MQRKEMVAIAYTVLNREMSEGGQDDDMQCEMVDLGSADLGAGLVQMLGEMAEGDVRDVSLAAEQAFGGYRTERVQVLDRSVFPPDVLEGGGAFKVHMQDGMICRPRVRAMTTSKVVIDTNHPLAGRDVTLRIRLLSRSDGSSCVDSDAMGAFSGT